jgi:hypothetical protein
MNCNVHLINQLKKQTLISYALTKPKMAVILRHYFHYKLFAIHAHGDLFINKCL